MIKRLFYDLETTGLDENKHAIHQLSGMIEINNIVVLNFDIKIRPWDGAILEAEALAVGNVTKEQIMAYPSVLDAYTTFTNMMSKHVDKFNPKDKFYLVGFNNIHFDDRWLRRLFEMNGDKYFNSWFWADSQDVKPLASKYLENVRKTMPNFRLQTVAKTLGIEVDQDKLHEASYDVYLTREAYHIVTSQINGHAV